MVFNCQVLWGTKKSFFYGIAMKTPFGTFTIKNAKNRHMDPRQTTYFLNHRALNPLAAFIWMRLCLGIWERKK